MRPNPVVHLELHTPNSPRACGFYTELFGWRVETVHSPAGRYLAVELGGRFQGGVVEEEARDAFWLPYVEVLNVGRAAERASQLGASVLITPREGPAGWRAAVETPAGGPVALWQPKR